MREERDGVVGDVSERREGVPRAAEGALRREEVGKWQGSTLANYCE